MLSISGIEIMMGILFQQTPWCFITSIGECPTYGFLSSAGVLFNSFQKVLFSNVMHVCCFCYELTSCQFDYNLSQFAILFP